MNLCIHRSSAERTLSKQAAAVLHLSHKLLCERLQVYVHSIIYGISQSNFSNHTSALVAKHADSRRWNAQSCTHILRELCIHLLQALSTRESDSIIFVERDGDCYRVHLGCFLTPGPERHAQGHASHPMDGLRNSRKRSLSLFHVRAESIESRPHGSIAEASCHDLTSLASADDVLRLLRPSGKTSRQAEVCKSSHASVCHLRRNLMTSSSPGLENVTHNPPGRVEHVPLRDSPVVCNLF